MNSRSTLSGSAELTVEAKAERVGTQNSKLATVKAHMGLFQRPVLLRNRRSYLASPVEPLTTLGKSKGGSCSKTSTKPGQSDTI